MAIYADGSIEDFDNNLVEIHTVTAGEITYSLLGGGKPATDDLKEIFSDEIHGRTDSFLVVKK